MGTNRTKAEVAKYRVLRAKGAVTRYTINTFMMDDSSGVAKKKSEGSTKDRLL